MAGSQLPPPQARRPAAEGVVEEEASRGEGRQREQCGGSGAPTGSGFTAIYSTGTAFAALKADGSISAWGDSRYGGSGAPAGSGFTAIYSTEQAFAALKEDGSISAWGDSSRGGSGAPTGSGLARKCAAEGDRHLHRPQRGQV